MVKEAGERRKAPRWSIAFLRALERTGEVRTAAEDAGIDHSTAYARRKAHEEFARDWDGAMYRYALAKEQREREEEDSAAPPRFVRSPSDAGEDVVAGGQVRRGGSGRWSKAKEEIFFNELAATANVTRAAEAAGVSTNAVYQRRLRNARFKAKWAAVLETGRTSIEMHVIEAARRAFDPDELDTGDVRPRVSVAEAIKIAQASARKAQKDAEPDPFAGDEADSYENEIADIRERLVRKLRRMRDRDRPDMIAQGWSLDEAYDHMVPPGWIRDPNHVPKEADQGGED